MPRVCRHTQYRTGALAPSPRLQFARTHRRNTPPPSFTCRFAVFLHRLSKASSSRVRLKKILTTIPSNRSAKAKTWKTPQSNGRHSTPTNWRIASHATPHDRSPCRIHPTSWSEKVISRCRHRQEVCTQCTITDDHCSSRALDVTTATSRELNRLFPLHPRSHLDATTGQERIARCIHTLKVSPNIAISRRSSCALHGSSEQGTRRHADTATRHTPDAIPTAGRARQ